LTNIKSTLVELIIKNFFEMKSKKRRNKIKTTDGNRLRHTSKFSISSILINSKIKEIKHRSRKKVLQEDEWTTIIDDESETVVNGGYGTVSKHYGASPSVNYTDYDKIWGHLGGFKTRSMYEGIESLNNGSVKNSESSGQLVSTETLDKAAKHFKYSVPGEILGDVGFVPPFGSNINSKDWEKYRLMTMMSIYQPLLKLKRSSV